MAKFHYQTVFISQVIQQNVFRVSCVGIWWRHDIRIPEKLKFDYLEKEKSFQSEIKTFFLVFKMLFFRHAKQTSKNIAETTFKDSYLILLSLHDFLSKQILESSDSNDIKVWEFWLFYENKECS